MLELRERVVEELRVDGLFDFVDFLHHAVPLRGQYLRSQFSPSGGGDFVVVGRKNTELIEQMCRVLVTATIVLKASIVVK